MVECSRKSIHVSVLNRLWSRLGISNTYTRAYQDVTGFSPFFLMFGRRLRIPFEILLTPPAKLHEEGWKAYNIEKASHLRRAYDMVKERDRVQQQKTGRL